MHSDKMYGWMNIYLTNMGQDEILLLDDNSWTILHLNGIFLINRAQEQKNMETSGEYMHAIEFQTTISHGIIEIPQQFRHHLSKHAKVIVLMEETPKKTGSVAQLLQHPVKREHFTPLSREEIYER
jgi:hypothetical protein